jgi:hypothetical protein
MEAQVISGGRIVGCKWSNRHDSWCDKYAILGVIIGLEILGLGVAKGMGTAKATLIATR